MALEQSSGIPTTAEERFRDAFHRLRDGRPRVLEPGTRVTQNNVAREAGCDPSALKKSRFPTLVAEIQAIASRYQDAGGGLRVRHRPGADACPRCTSLRTQIHETALQRDAAMSALVLSDARVLELAQRVLELERAAAGEPHRRLPR